MLTEDIEMEGDDDANADTSSIKQRELFFPIIYDLSQIGCIMVSVCLFVCLSVRIIAQKVIDE